MFSARNAGLNEAKGDFVVFVDGGDKISPIYCETMLKEMQEDEHTDFIICNYIKVLDVKEILVNTNLPLGFLNRKFIVENLIEGIVSNEIPYHGEDWWFNICLLDKAKKIKVINDYLYYYSINNNPLSLSKKFDERQLEILINSNLDFLKLIKKYNLSESIAVTGSLENFINYLIKARISLERHKFLILMKKVSNSVELQSISKLQNNLTGLNALLLKYITNTKYVFWLVTIMSSKRFLIELLKSTKGRFL